MNSSMTSLEPSHKSPARSFMSLLDASKAAATDFAMTTGSHKILIFHEDLVLSRFLLESFQGIESSIAYLSPQNSSGSSLYDRQVSALAKEYSCGVTPIDPSPCSFDLFERIRREYSVSTIGSIFKIFTLTQVRNPLVFAGSPDVPNFESGKFLELLPNCELKSVAFERESGLAWHPSFLSFNDHQKMSFWDSRLTRVAVYLARRGFNIKFNDDLIQLILSSEMGYEATHETHRLSFEEHCRTEFLKNTSIDEFKLKKIMGSSDFRTPHRASSSYLTDAARDMFERIDTGETAEVSKTDIKSILTTQSAEIVLGLKSISGSSDKSRGTKLRSRGHDVEFYPVFPQLLAMFMNPDHNMNLVEKLENRCNWGENTGNLISNKNLHKLPEFDDLLAFFHHSIQEYFREIKLKYSSYEIPICWANKSLRGQFHQLHTHSNSFLSAVYYVHGSSGNTAFFSNSAISWQVVKPVYNGVNDWNAEIFEVAPEPGKLILFPSHLHHSVSANNSETPRYTISFNVIFRGEVGSLTEANWAKI